MSRLCWFVSALLWACFGVSGSADAEPIVTVVFLAAATLGASSATALAIAEFVTFVVLPNIALTIVSQVMLRANMPDPQARQAGVTTLSLGEGPREFVFGEVAIAGQLIDAYNFGFDEDGTDYESLVIALADHEIDALLGFYIGDQYYPFAAEGDQPGFREQLKITFRRGTLDQPSAVPPEHTGGRWTEADNLAGVAYVVVTYLFDVRDEWKETPMWSTGRPQFLWHVRGARLYDPRHDDTVAGGFGPMRWNAPATWAWSDNAYLARYNFARGIYAGGQVGELGKLLIGRGLSVDEAPPERAISRANICDELVARKDGTVEKRYRANGVVRADEPFIAVEEMFAACMAGVITQPEGGVDIDPGVAKAVAFDITDADLSIGFPVKVEQFVSDSERVNTLLGRYTAPDQLWRDVAAPIRRSSADIIADGGPRPKTLPLSFVTSHTQAQRVAEIDRRLGRREVRASLTLSPRFSKVEEGDWITWTSARHFGGKSITFRVEAQSVDQGYRAAVLLRQIDGQVFTWSAETDEGTPGEAPIEASEGAIKPAQLTDVNVQAYEFVGDDGSRQPSIIATWAAPVDSAVVGVRLEVRAPGSDKVSQTLATTPDSGLMMTQAGVTADSLLEARLVPIPAPGRGSIASEWLSVRSGKLVVSGVAKIGDLTPAQLISKLAGVDALGKALTRDALETFVRLVEEREELVKESYVDGQPMRTIVANEISERVEGETLILSQMSLMGVMTLGGDAWRMSRTTLMANDEQTWGEYTDSLQANFGATNAAITQQGTTLTSAIAAQAQTLNAVSTTLNGNVATVTQLASSVNGLQSEYNLAVSSTSGGVARIAGVRAWATPTFSALAFTADQIGFSNGSTTLFPLSIVGSIVRAPVLQAGLVYAGSIVTDSISANNIVETVPGADNSTVTLNNGSPVTAVACVPYVVRGKVTVRTLVNISNAGGEATAIVEIKRDGSTIDSYVQFCQGAWGNNATLWEVDDAPGVGSHTYSVVITRNTAGGGPLTKTRARIVAELRKTEA